jgi:3-oxoacyl-[acyl-carrier-protein] synthase II
MSTLGTPIEAYRGRVRSTGEIAVTGWSIYVPGCAPGDIIKEADGAEPARPPERSHELLGRKGLLSKDAATRFALCAVHSALRLPPGASRSRSAPDPQAAVVASSNLGNVATVHNIARALADGGIREVSPLDAPNASSNVIASAVAIWFKFGGPNLMVCSGATSGLDALSLACIMLRTGRARRVIVVGTEPDDEVAKSLYRKRAALRRGGGDNLRAGAACVVLEFANDIMSAAPVLGAIRPSPEVSPGTDGRGPSILIGPEHVSAGNVRLIDPVQQVGDTYGAMGVLQVAMAAALIAAAPAGETPSVAVVCGDEVDGWRSLTVNGRRYASAPDRAKLTSQ